VKMVDAKQSILVFSSPENVKKAAARCCLKVDTAKWRVPSRREMLEYVIHFAGGYKDTFFNRCDQWHGWTAAALEIVPLIQSLLVGSMLGDSGVARAWLVWV